MEMDQPDQTFGLPEETVADLVGLTKRDLAQHRGPMGGRWAKGPNKLILWSAAGVEDLKRELQPETGGPEAPKTENAAPAPEIVVVLSARLPNPRVLLACRPGVDGHRQPEKRLTVYLGANGTNTLFIPGMSILARPHRGAAWIFEGNPDAPERGRRMPRAIGHW